MPTEPSSGQRPWQERISRTGYFVGALFLHVIVFVLLAGYIVTKSYTPPSDFSIVPHTRPIQVPPQPPQTPVVPTDVDVSVHPAPVTPVPVDVPGGPTVIKTPIPSDISNAADAGAAASGVVGNTIKPQNTKGPSPQRLKDIGKFVGIYRTPKQIAEHDPSGTYPVYVAQYADGDWDCNIQRDAKGEINAGSMPDLTAKIKEWSNNSIKANVIPKPLNIGGPELLDTNPPFIFFTGHKDFILSDQEIKNLQVYLEKGGAIWGDNALAGKGSRFDVAFKREMKRVVPDLDCQFQPLDMTSDLFSTKQRFHIADIPLGMNFYREPIEHLDIDGELAILYTPNDYSDLYAMRILPGDKEIAPPYIPRHSTSPLITNGTFLYNERMFFRNFTLESSLTAHRLGMNIVIYLITRFDDKLLLAP